MYRFVRRVYVAQERSDELPLRAETDRNWPKRAEMGRNGPKRAPKLTLSTEIDWNKLFEHKFKLIFYTFQYFQIALPPRLKYERPLVTFKIEHLKKIIDLKNNKTLF